MPYDQQLDLYGGAHDLAPTTRQERLFQPAPGQLDGQTFLGDRLLLEGEQVAPDRPNTSDQQKGAS